MPLVCFFINDSTELKYNLNTSDDERLKLVVPKQICWLNLIHGDWRKSRSHEGLLRLLCEPAEWYLKGHDVGVIESITQFLKS
jgi:hypothetical protein